jgi:hypothetical protein
VDLLAQPAVGEPGPADRNAAAASSIQAASCAAAPIAARPADRAVEIHHHRRSPLQVGREALGELGRADQAPRHPRR